MANLTLDVRPYHERGEEPFQTILDAARQVGPGEELLLINSFEPIPLYTVLGRIGFTHQTSEQAPDEWHIRFQRQATTA